MSVKRLLIARHAKSSWTNSNLRDHDRPLNSRGRASAPAVGQALLERGFQPDLVLSSTSQRTEETWDGMEPYLPGTVVDFRRDLYLASPGDLVDAIAATDDNIDTLMTLAHNPGSHSLAAALGRSGPPELVGALQSKFPTGAVAVIELSIERWTELREGVLVDFICPRDL